MSSGGWSSHIGQEGPDGLPDLPESRARGDDIERSLLEVRELIEDIVVKYRDREFLEPLVHSVKPDTTTLAAVAEKMLGQATSGVDVILASDADRSGRIDELLRHTAATRGDSVKIRLLRTRATLGRDFARDHQAAAGDFDVRIARIPVLDSLIVDGRNALVFAESTLGPQASVTTAPEVIETLRALFTGVWRNALSVTDRIDLGDRGRTEFARRILVSLHAGITDEVAARELSVSVRTYRRYVADILDQLGANSRFQAGVYAAELGLLPSSSARRT